MIVPNTQQRGGFSQSLLILDGSILPVGYFWLRQLIYLVIVAVHQMSSTWTSARCLDANGGASSLFPANVSYVSSWLQDEHPHLMPTGKLAGTLSTMVVQFAQLEPSFRRWAAELKMVS